MISVTDDENISLVKEEMADIRKRLNSTSNNKRIQGAYNSSVNSITSHYFDEKSRRHNGQS